MAAFRPIFCVVGLIRWVKYPKMKTLWFICSFVPFKGWEAVCALINFLEFWLWIKCLEEMNRNKNIELWFLFFYWLRWVVWFHNLFSLQCIANLFYLLYKSTVLAVLLSSSFFNFGLIITYLDVDKYKGKLCKHILPVHSTWYYSLIFILFYFIICYFTCIKFYLPLENY